MIGKTDDIIHLLMHDFYDPAEYTFNVAGYNPTYPKEYKDQIGRYLKLSCIATEVNTYYYLTQQGHIITRMDMIPFSEERLWDPVVQKRINPFNSKIKRC